MVLNFALALSLVLADIQANASMRRPRRRRLCGSQSDMSLGAASPNTASFEQVFGDGEVGEGYPHRFEHRPGRTRRRGLCRN